MNKPTIIRGIAAVLIVIAVGYRALKKDVETAPDSSESHSVAQMAGKSDPHPSFLYGRVTTYDGVVYQGQLRWGGNEEAFWGNYFNGLKDQNPWVDLIPADQRAAKRQPRKIFGIEITRGDTQPDMSRPFMTRYGDIARIEAFGEGLDAVIEHGIDYDPDVRVTLKSGTVFNLDRHEAGDFDDGVRVWDAEHGVVDLGPRQIRSIELLPSKGSSEAPNRLYGTVVSSGGEFTGFLQWDRQQVLGSDELFGKGENGERRLQFDAIRSIVKVSPGSSRITLSDGQDIVLSGTRHVGEENRGVYVDDSRFGRVLVSWDAFERVDFSWGGSGPVYDDFQAGRVITGSVTTRSGRSLSGRLVYDLDESETTETLDAPSQGVDYTIPFGMIASIDLPSSGQGAGVTLHNGEKLNLERAGDLSAENAGLLVFPVGSERAEFVSWIDVERITLDSQSPQNPL